MIASDTDYRLVDGPQPGLAILYRPDFLGPDECRELIATFERSGDRLVRGAKSHRWIL